jgi:hypothetical protein
MDEIDLSISEAANTALNELSREMDFSDPVAAVIWHEGVITTDCSGKTTKKGPGWGVGWYASEKVAGEPLQVIAGIKFVFGQGERSKQLNGKVLDYKAGRFVVVERKKRI